MTESTVAVIAILLLGWAVLSGALARHNVTGPLLFVVAGYLVGNPDWGPLPVELDTVSVHAAAEWALALVLFSDAARVNVSALRHDLSQPARLLGVGLPLSIGLGGAAAAWLLGMPWALAGFVGAALAPTDAALSGQIIEDERIPARIRRSLNVESGLNDGIAAPVVSVLLAVAASQLGTAAETEAFEFGSALRALAVGAVVGPAVGALAVGVLVAAVRRRWVAIGGRRLATLATAVAAFTLAIALDGNGFIAAFLAGVAFGAFVDAEVVDVEEAALLPELGGELLALVVWFLFGATLVPVIGASLDGPLLVYALVSLTIVRMLPVAVSMIGSGADRATVVFLGWFGPRGLASVVFALLAVEQLGEGTRFVDRAVAVVALTVLASVVLHGITAGPGGRGYARKEREAADVVEHLRPRRSALRRP